ncbi:MAG: hypothetical protein IKM28_03075, partial [Lachnospiraceae bacterium]|nr:hypothetical protein [Lachnospiraceae bacterium]
MKRLSARLLALGLVVCSVSSNVYAASPMPVVMVKDAVVVGNDTAEAVTSEVGVHARFSSNRIVWEAVDGATTYTVSRKAEDGTWTSLSSDVSGLEYVDTEAGTGTQHSYKVVADNEKEALKETKATYATGVEAVQKSAELHVDLALDTDTGRTFDGSRKEDISDKIGSIKDLTGGTILVTYKPTADGDRRALLIATAAGVTLTTTEGNSGLSQPNKGFMLVQDATRGKVRVEFSSTFKGDYTGGSTKNEWNTYSLTADKGTDVAVAAVDNNNAFDWSKRNLGRFFKDITDLTTLTIGAAINNGETQCGFMGEIAYVTITSELLSQAELKAYNVAANELAAKEIDEGGGTVGVGTEGGGTDGGGTEG